MKTDFEPHVLRIKKLLKKDKSQACLYIYDVYCRLAKELFFKYYFTKNQKDRHIIIETVKEILKWNNINAENLKKANISLNKWIKIYRTLGIFKKFENECFNPELLYYLRNIRTIEGHPIIKYDPEELKKMKFPKKVRDVDNLYILLVNALINSKLIVYNKNFGLCEFCFKELAKRKDQFTKKRIGPVCSKKLKIIENYSEDLETRVKNYIFSIIKIVNPKIVEKFERYAKEKIEHPEDFLKRQNFRNLKLEELNDTQIKMLKEAERYWEKQKRLLFKENIIKSIQPFFDNLFEIFKISLLNDEDLYETYYEDVIFSLADKFYNELGNLSKAKEIHSKKLNSKKLTNKKTSKYPFKYINIEHDTELELVPYDIYEPKIIIEDLRNLKGDEYIKRLVTLEFMNEIISNIKEWLEKLTDIEKDIFVNYKTFFEKLGEMNIIDIFNILNIQKILPGKCLINIILSSVREQN